MKNYRRLTALLILISSVVFAQTSQFNLPVNFKKAYNKQTRSLDGLPGKNYWQNKSDYKIKAELDPKTRTLSGKETITYFNNSPDTLKQIVVRLYQDIFRKGSVREFEINPLAVTNGTEIKKLFLDGREISLSGSKNSPVRNATNLFIPLESKLPPNGKSILDIEWSVIIPNQSQVRMGAYDSTSFFVAYWYPQVAVYDDIDGWDVLNYSGHTEMYNDFNNYEVELTVPNGFLIWSTGVLKNPQEVFSKNILEKYSAALKSDSIINVVDKKDFENGQITNGRQKLTYKIIAEYVQDFAFATSDHYLWDASSIIVDKSTGRRAFVSATFNVKTKDFSTVAEVARKSIEGFSTYLPGVPYPYPTMTVFNGQGGMEFPMMCNNSAIANVQGTVHLTSHEIFHTYFPFYMGGNERKYAWMDEGFATMIPFDFQTENAPGYDPRSRNAQSYAEFAGKDTDVPPMIPSHQLNGPSYRTASYRRPGAAFEFLRQFLGDEKFSITLKEFIYRWNEKHPTPYDFFYTFENVLGEYLEWFWKPWFFEFKYPDLSFGDFKIENGSFACSVKNIGGLPLPVIVKVIYNDGTEETVFYKNASVWKNAGSTVSLNVLTNKKIEKVLLGDSQIPDVDLSNNQKTF